MIDLENLTLEELYNMQEVFKINKIIGEKELKFKKGVKYDNDRK